MIQGGPTTTFTTEDESAAGALRSLWLALALSVMI